jgi:glycyl-tRNA synthetase beta chain
LGFKYDVVNAVLAADADDVVDAVARARAVSKIRESSDFVPIFVAFRRLKGILQQAAQREILVGEFIPSFSDPAEIQVWNSLQETGAGFQSLIGDRKYDEALEVAARLKPSIDMYFDKVMVMVDNPEVRQNRLALVKSLIDVFSQIADFSDIVTEGRG